MREMVLNHASFAAQDQYATIGYLKDIAVGMAQLCRDGVVQAVLRTCQPVQEIRCLSGYSLSEAFQDIRKAGAREEYNFLMRLVTKVPLLRDVGADVECRFHASESRALPPEDGKPLLLCALTNWVAVGLPSDPWDRDRITVSFDELLPNESIVEAAEEVDNLARSIHAPPICERHRARLRAGLDGRTLWKNSHTVFPKLVFAPSVEKNLIDLQAESFSPVVKRLTALNAATEDWQNVEGPAPPWTCHVTDESDTVKNNPVLRQARQFMSHQGSEEVFMWHARFGSGGRIHLRFDAHSKVVEIGYIGSHLPL